MVSSFRAFSSVLSCVILLSLPTTALGCILPDNYAALQAEALANLNAERKAEGLAPLRPSAKLEKAAQGHACDNAARRSISHESSDGGTLKTRLRKVGYAFRTAAENTGRGFASGTRAVEWWMNSPKHRTNILLRKARDVGIGVAVSPAPDSKLHWILVVGAGR